MTTIAISFIFHSVRSHKHFKLPVHVLEMNNIPYINWVVDEDKLGIHVCAKLIKIAQFCSINVTVFFCKQFM